jgi:hypothetical protein
LAALALASAATTGAAAGATAGPGGGGASPAGGASSAGVSSGTGASSGTASSSQNATATSGGAGIGAAPPLPFPRPTVPGDTAKIINGLAYAPADAPLQVQEAIWAGDRIRLKPYAVGGGHGRWNDVAYDCSGSVSYVMHAAGLLKVSMDSSEFEAWGHRGLGQWITVYTDPAHAFVQIAGIRFDTSAEDDPNPPSGTGPRWRPLMTSTAGFMARHPRGL